VQPPGAVLQALGPRESILLRAYGLAAFRAAVFIGRAAQVVLAIRADAVVELGEELTRATIAAIDGADEPNPRDEEQRRGRARKICRELSATSHKDHHRDDQSDIEGSSQQDQPAKPPYRGYKVVVRIDRLV
jgi:hypothetical protein